MSPELQFEIILDFFNKLHKSDPVFTDSILRSRHSFSVGEDELPEDLIVRIEDDEMSASVLGVFNTLLERLRIPKLAVSVDLDTDETLKYVNYTGG
jgi:hypothetical protein